MSAKSTNPPNAAKPLCRGLALLLVFLGLTLTLQLSSGAYHAEFAGYPDESAHYVTSLMVRDFIAGRDYTEPMKFATDYYTHYPKVAFGHWPPLFYVLAGLWMLLFSTSRVSILLFMALLTTAFAWLTSVIVQRHFGWIAGALAGLLLICIPIVQIYSDEIMAESLLGIVSLASAMYFARYMNTLRWQDSACFGAFASLAIMTKGNGWDLAIVPPVALLLTRRFSMLARWTFWLPAIIVSLTCAPWQLLTMHMAQTGWDGGGHPTLDYTFRALREFVPLFIGLIGWGLAPLILLGIIVTIVLPCFKNSVDAEWATMFALIPAAWIFHSIVPAGVESRKLIISVPVLILFLFAGGSWLTQRLRRNHAFVAAAAFFVFALQQFTIPSEIHYGYLDAAQFIIRRPDLQNLKILVSSERDGEGMLVSELAMNEKRPGHVIIRATKALSKTNWAGHVFECYYKTPEEMLNYLHQTRIGLVVSDTFLPISSFQYQRVLNQTLVKFPAQLKSIASFKGSARGQITVYLVIPPADSPQPNQAELERTGQPQHIVTVRHEAAQGEQVVPSHALKLPEVFEWSGMDGAVRHHEAHTVGGSYVAITPWMR